MVKWNSGNKVYIVGGVNDGGFLASTQVLDIETRDISVLQGQLKIARYTQGCILLEQDRKLLVAGLIDSAWEATYTMEILDLDAGTWNDAADMPFTSGGYKTFPLDGNMYLLRGNGFFYHYNLANDQWDLVTETGPFDGPVHPQYLTIDINLASVCQYL